jgi:hypothetical protein
MPSPASPRTADLKQPIRRGSRYASSLGAGSPARRGVSSMAEQWAFNPLVQGSTPWRPTRWSSRFGGPCSRFGTRPCRRICRGLGPGRMRPGRFRGNVRRNCVWSRRREMSALQDVPVATLQHAVAVLADENLVVVRRGRTTVVAGDATPDRRSGPASRPRDHDCKRAGCQPHMCKPLTAKTVRNIHSILSGAFATAKRWEWIAGNPAESAKPAAALRRPLPATSPEDVTKVIAQGHKTHPEMALATAAEGHHAAALCGSRIRDGPGIRRLPRTVDRRIRNQRPTRGKRLGHALASCSDTGQTSRWRHSRRTVPRPECWRSTTGYWHVSSAALVFDPFMLGAGGWAPQCEAAGTILLR